MIVVRTTCSEAVGLGHYRRCLTLAREVQSPVVFALAADARGLALARADGVLVRGPDFLDGDALVLDDYALGEQDIAALHARIPKLLVLDDHGRALDCDAVLNANPAAPPYDVPLPLCGPRYALLRPEFRDLPRRTAGPLRRVVVTLGGSNPGGLTAQIAEILREALPDVTVDVVAGPLFEGTLPDEDRVVIHRAPVDMVGLFSRADLAVAAGGQTTYELAACGVPALAICAAENQRANLEALSAAGTLRVTSLDTLIDDIHAVDRHAMAAAGQALVDGYGAQRAWRELSARWGLP